MQPTLWTHLFHFITRHPPISAPVHVGGTGSSELETSWRSGYKMLSGSSMKNFSVDFSYLTHSSLTFNLREK